MEDCLAERMVEVRIDLRAGKIAMSMAAKRVAMMTLKMATMRAFQLTVRWACLRVD